MTKLIPIDPAEVRQPGVLKFPEIPLNAYRPDPKAEAAKYATENLVRIYRDMLYIREFETMLDRIKREGSYGGLEYNHKGPAHLSIGQESAAVGTLHFALCCLAATPQEDLKKIKREIKEQREKIEIVEKRERSILTELEETGKDLSTVETELRKYRRRLKNTESEIAKVEADISLNRGNVERQREMDKEKTQGYAEELVPRRYHAAFLGSRRCLSIDEKLEKPGICSAL